MIDTLPDTQPTTDRQRREALYRAFEEHVDPATYHGGTCCLVDQTSVALAGEAYSEGPYSNVDYLAERFGVDREPIDRIYGDVCYPPYAHNYAAAMQMAKERLGLA